MSLRNAPKLLTHWLSSTFRSNDGPSVAEKRLAIARKIGLRAIVTEFATGVLKELDYRNEAYHARRLADGMQRFVAWYREYYRDQGFDLPLDDVRAYLPSGGTRTHLGLKYYRITDRRQEHREPYEPARADARVREHADHFVRTGGCSPTRCSWSWSPSPA